MSVCAGAERVQMVLGAVVRAEQRLAWAKVLTRLGAATRIQALVSTEHGRGLPRLVGELLLTASISTTELVIARTEMQVCKHPVVQGFAVPLRQLSYLAWAKRFGINVVSCCYSGHPNGRKGG